MGKKVLLVDSDEQGSLRDWYAAAPEDHDFPTMVALDNPALLKEVRKFAAEYDFALIDGTPKNMKMIATGVRLSDIVLVPVQPSELDLWAAESVVELCEVRQEADPTGLPRIAFIISRAIARTRIARNVVEALEENGAHVFEGKTDRTQSGAHIFEAKTINRITYAEAVGKGQSVFEYEPDGDAAREIRKLAREFLEFAK